MNLYEEIRALRLAGELMGTAYRGDDRSARTLAEEIGKSIVVIADILNELRLRKVEVSE